MNNFTKYHCLISQEDFTPREFGIHNFQIEEKEKNYAYFYYLFSRVGTMWKWDLRPKYKLEQKSIKERLESDTSRLFIFKKGQQLIGYCFITESEEQQVTPYKNLIEIENFGFFPEHTKKGYGHFFLNNIFEILFQEYDHIYLTTRSTNHSKVVPFYERNDMSVIAKECLNDDLLYEFYAETDDQKQAA